MTIANSITDRDEAFRKIAQQVQPLFEANDWRYALANDLKVPDEDDIFATLHELYYGWISQDFATNADSNDNEVCLGRFSIQKLTYMPDLTIKLVLTQ